MNDFDALEDQRDDAIIGLALKWSLLILLFLAMVAGAVAYYLTRSKPAKPLQVTPLSQVEVRETSQQTLPEIPFTDITATAGIDFVHENGFDGRKLLPETMGGGCAFFDFDNDGDQDLLFVNSEQWSDSKAEQHAATMALYANDGTGQFKDVTADAGLNVSFYGMGVAVGDYDNDGWQDLYFTAVGKNSLFHNEGNGKFRDVTTAANVAGGDDEWSTSCGWFDYDRDGDLDLFVCNYVVWSPEYDLSQNFQLTGGDRAYGRPQNFEGTFPYLFRNDGDKGFTEVAEAAGMHMRNPATDVPMAKSLGVTFADFDHDGWLDVIVANDTVQNFLFRNRQDGTFEEVGTLSGVAFDMNGAARGAMGIDAARFRNDEAMGIAIGNFSNEMTALYVAYGDALQFVDEAISSGLGPSTRLSLSFGVFFFDSDLDSRLDLFSANGHLEQDINRVQPSQHYEQPPQLFWNCGSQFDTEFVPLTTSQLGDDFTKPLVGRGAAYADIDADGDLDLVITTSGRAPRLLRNDQQLQHHWIQFSLDGDGQVAIGATVEVDVADQTLRQQLMPTRSYLSQVESTLTFGLGRDAEIQAVRILWPNGTQQTLSTWDLDRLNTVTYDKMAEK